MSFMYRVREYANRTIERIGAYPVLQAFGAGLLMGSVFVHPFFWWAGIAGLLLLLWVLERRTSAKQAFWILVIAGVTKSLLAYLWLFSIYPLDWIGDLSVESQLVAITWMWIVSGFSVGVSYGVLGVCMYLIKGLGRRSYLYFPVLLVLTEMLGALLFSLAQAGPGSGINIYTTFGHIGYALAQHGLLGHLAKFGGVYSLIFISALIALFFFVHTKRLKRTNWSDRTLQVRCCIGLLLFFGTFGINVPITTLPVGYSVATINTEFGNMHEASKEVKADRVRAILDAFTVALGSDVDSIVFPETAYALNVFGKQENIFAFIRSNTNRDVLVIDSDGAVVESGEPVVRAVVYDSKTLQRTVAYKQYLVPGGEYVPYHLNFLMSFFGFDDTSSAYLNKQFAFTPGEKTEFMYDRVPGILFCSEIVSPFHTRIAAKSAGIPIIIHPISHGWFHTPTMFWHQMSLIHKTQVRSVGVPLVQVANLWESRAYDAFGNPIQGETIYETASTSVVVYEL